jgi:hypothetical protein
MPLPVYLKAFRTISDTAVAMRVCSERSMVRAWASCARALAGRDHVLIVLKCEGKGVVHR